MIDDAGKWGVLGAFGIGRSTPPYQGYYRLEAVVEPLGRELMLGEDGGASKLTVPRVRVNEKMYLRCTRIFLADSRLNLGSFRLLALALFDKPSLCETFVTALPAAGVYGSGRENVPRGANGDNGRGVGSEVGTTITKLWGWGSRRRARLREFAARGTTPRNRDAAARWGFRSRCRRGIPPPFHR